MKTVSNILFGLCASLAALVLLGIHVGCASNQTPAQEIQAWDAILQHSVSIVRATVAAQPPGPKRDKLLAQIDQISTWEALGAALSEAVAQGITVPPVQATQPTK